MPTLPPRTDDHPPQLPFVKPPTETSSPADSDAGPSLFAGVARHSMVYAFGIIVGRAVSFLMLPIYTRFLTPADYGVLALVEMTLDFISIIAGAKLALGVFRYYHKAESEQERQEVVSTSFLLVAGMYAVVGTATFFAAPLLSTLIFGSTENTVLFQISAMNAALGALLIVPLSLARVEDRSVFFVGMNLAKLAMQVVFVILFLVVMDLGVLGVFLGALVANVAVAGAASLWLLRRVKLAWTSKAARDLLRYGVPLMATKVATFATTFSDRYFLQVVADETTVGLYNLAYQFGFIMVMLGFSPIEQIWGPKRFQVANESNPDSVLSHGFLLINMLLISVAVGISLFVYDLLRVMATPAFYPAAMVVPVILFAYVFQSWASIVDIGILVVEKTRYVALANFIAAGVALTGYALLIPRYLEWGAAIATLLAFMTQFGLIYLFAQRLWPVRYAWRPVVLLVAWAVTISVIGLLLPEMSVLPSISVRFGLALCFFGGLWFLPIMSREQRVLVRGWIRRWIKGRLGARRHG